MMTQAPTLAQIFQEHQGLVAHKFPHHMMIYDRLFASFRENPDISIIEIGIANGGSLQLWRKYFGENASVIGIDIQDKTELATQSGAKIFVGDQGAHDFWEIVTPQLGNPHIIIDDGSHRCNDQIMTFDSLFPILQDGGLYIIEDIHTSYRSAYGGGLRAHGSLIEHLKRMVDDIHIAEHQRQSNMNHHSHVFSIQLYPNLAVIEKRNPKYWGGSTMRPA